jgi:synaptojanin
VQNKLAFRIVEDILDRLKDLNRRNNQGGMKAFKTS